MMNWIRKVVVTFTVVLTFGVVAPSPHVSTHKSDSSSKSSGVGGKGASEVTSQSEQQSGEDQQKKRSDLAQWSWQEMAASTLTPDELRAKLPVFVVKQAEKQGIEKFGPVIAGQVGDEYRHEILPRVGEVMQKIAGDIDEESLWNLEISDEPSSGRGEKIFHVSDMKKGEDLVRFHVRQDHPPQSGFWFNFHYHLPMDQYQGHYEIGRIFWNKDVPPKWKA